MGAHPTDYARSAPYRSYIHVDEFESPKELAEYLHRLDRDDELYNSYFRWKGTGEFINTYFWCRVCAMLHDERPPKFYKDVNEWWRGDGICTTTSWREHDQTRAGNLKNTWKALHEVWLICTTRRVFYTLSSKESSGLPKDVKNFTDTDRDGLLCRFFVGRVDLIWHVTFLWEIDGFSRVQCRRETTFG